MTSESPLDTLHGLMVATLKGDKAACENLLFACEALVRVYLHGAFRKQPRWDRAQAEDIVQEVLMAVYFKRHTFDESLAFEPWLLSIARYKLIDWVRKGTRRREQGLDHAPELMATFVDPSTSMELSEQLSKLPERAQRALRLVKLEGLTSADAAAMLGMSESSLKVTVHRCLKLLKKSAGAQ
jgi:RNA polymerase sigma-70 factor, ECF subfamily